MDIVLTEDEALLAETADRLGADLGIHAVAELDDRVADPPVEALASAGLRGLRIPEAMGGAGGSGTHTALVAEAMGKHLVTAPFVGPVIAAEVLVRGGASPETLAAIAAGELELAIGCAPDLGSLDATSAAIAFDAASATGVVVLDGARVSVRGVGERVPFADLTRVVREIDDVELLTDPMVLSEPDRGVVDAFALIVVSADLLGVMQGALNLAVEHAKQREQFGVPIGSFQAVQQICAEQLVTIEGARDCLSYAAWALDECAPGDALIAAHTAKAYCAPAARRVVEAAIQVLGGIGMTWEHPAHLYLRRAIAGGCLFGGEDVQLDAIAHARLGVRGAR